MLVLVFIREPHPAPSGRLFLISSSVFRLKLLAQLLFLVDSTTQSSDAAPKRIVDSDCCKSPGRSDGPRAGQPNELNNQELEG